ncbi:DUF917 domain-containing protein [Kineosporia mesophila]|uniref:DUF917 domain-containing protein n=1 Tax=Kineosporia mesophila TaxID=566012 RepID=A0ABP7AEX3_9ACTN|nr:DUF917 domain-containing protein [Kineosporia mesophila]MCD5352869.1 DUF917 domain-containing protein [Kineosporia mesophila]
MHHSQARRVIDLADVDALAAGAAIFGTGGGGAVHTSRLATRLRIEEFGPVPLVGVDELTPDDAVITMSAMGAPGVGLEVLTAAGQAQTLVREVERYIGRKVTTVMATEIGGSNGVTPVAWAARAGLAVLDADQMGRAFPMATMTSTNVAKLPMGVAVMCDGIGNVSLLHPVNGAWLERHARALTVASGGIALGAGVLRVEDAQAGAVIRGTVSRAIEVGHHLLGSPEPVAALVEVLGAALLITGKVIDVERVTEGGFTRGSVTVEGIGGDRDRLVRVEIQNENLVALEDGEVLVSVPDLITVVDSETGEAISTENLRFGQRIAVLAWPCDPLWRTERGLELTGPPAFGYDIPYVPLTVSSEGAVR